MPTPNATNTASVVITMADANGVISITRSAGNPQLGGNYGDLTVNVQLANGANIIALPASPVQNIYVKNNAANGSGQTVTVLLTPQGGAQATLAQLQPGSIFLWWNTINTVPAGGYSAMTLTASAANIPVEYFLGN